MVHRCLRCGETGKAIGDYLAVDSSRWPVCKAIGVNPTTIQLTKLETMLPSQLESLTAKSSMLVAQPEAMMELMT